MIERSRQHLGIANEIALPVAVLGPVRSDEGDLLDEDLLGIAAFRHDGLGPDEVPWRFACNPATWNFSVSRDWHRVNRDVSRVTEQQKH
jgi:hypothetical protein